MKENSPQRVGKKWKCKWKYNSQLNVTAWKHTHLPNDSYPAQLSSLLFSRYLTRPSASKNLPPNQVSIPWPQSPQGLQCLPSTPSTPYPGLNDAVRKSAWQHQTPLPALRESSVPREGRRERRRGEAACAASVYRKQRCNIMGWAVQLLVPSGTLEELSLWLGHSPQPMTKSKSHRTLSFTNCKGLGYVGHIFIQERGPVHYVCCVYFIVWWQ